jgi:hypothetical protein
LAISPPGAGESFRLALTQSMAGGLRTVNQTAALEKK